MTESDAPAGGAAIAPPPDRDPDLVLARVHLRLGSLGLARTELETLAGRGALDDDGIRDLAEARWRTGDLDGASEAASTYLAKRPNDIVGLVIAAEGQAAAGRPAEARRLAGRAIDQADGSLDPIFAGMPRSPIWPIEAGAAAGPAGVLFDDLHPGPHPLGPSPSQDGVAEADAERERVERPHDGPSLWGDEVTLDGGAEPAAEPGDLFRSSRAALEAGRSDDAAAGLILALRASPALAPAVLDLLAGRSEPILAVVRGDAARIVGHDVEAMRDHASAAARLSEAAAAAAGATDDAPDAPFDLDPTHEPDQETS